jgi:hypothetical protein
MIFGNKGGVGLENFTISFKLATDNMDDMKLFAWLNKKGKSTSVEEFILSTLYKTMAKDIVDELQSSKKAINFDELFEKFF